MVPGNRWQIHFKEKPCAFAVVSWNRVEESLFWTPVTAGPLTDLRCVDDLPQRPHQGAVDPHQLLSADLVGFVQHHAHLVLVVLQGSDHLGELVGDVQLVGVEQEDDAVHALGEPLQHGGEIITWEKRTQSSQSDSRIWIQKRIQWHGCHLLLVCGIYDLLRHILDLYNYSTQALTVTMVTLKL